MNATPSKSPGPLCIVTRPAAQAGPAVLALQAAGLRAAALPLIAIGPPADPAPVHAAWAALPACALVMFVSANAVQYFFALGPVAKPAWPAAVIAACTGPGTAAALRAAGVPATAIVLPPPGAPQESESLWEQLTHLPWAGRQVWVVRGEQGRDWLAECLREQGAHVNFVAAYQRQPPTPDAAGRALLAAAQAASEGHLWLFSSSEAVANLQGLAPGADWSRSAALASHPRIAAVARGAGFGTVDQQGLAPGDVATWLRARPPQARPPR